MPGEFNKAIKMRRQEVLASQIGDDAPFGAAIFPVVSQQAGVFELDPFGPLGSDRE